MSARARAGLEAAVLASLAIVPAAPYAGYMFAHGVPRFSMFGDYAVLEQVARDVWSGRTLLGPYSRFGFSHPGPLYFYFLAPIFLFFPVSSEGLFVGAFVLNLAAAATVVVAARLLGSRVHGIAALVVVLAWFVAFGNIVANPWNPLVIALPLVAFLVLAAFFVAGESAASWPAALLGALVAQSHVATVITVAGVGAASTLAFWIRRRGTLERRDRRRLVLGAGILCLTALPPLVEQCTSPEGNLTKIVLFFLHRPEPLKPLSNALRDWAFSASWLADRVFDLSLLKDRGVPLPMRWDPLPGELTHSARSFACAHVILVAIAAWVAGRRRDARSLALLTVGAAVEALAIVALRAIVGPDFYYLVFWVTAGSTVAWIGVAATAGTALGDAVRGLGRRGWQALIALGVAASWTTMTVQRIWIEHNVGPVVLPLESHALHDVYDSLVATLQRDGASAIVHLDHGDWNTATVVFLELLKDHLPASIDGRDAFVFGGRRPPPSADTVRHVYVGNRIHPLPPSPCFEPVAASDDLTLAISREDIDGCGAAR